MNMTKYFEAYNHAKLFSDSFYLEKSIAMILIVILLAITIALCIDCYKFGLSVHESKVIIRLSIMLINLVAVGLLTLHICNLGVRSKIIHEVQSGIQSNFKVDLTEKQVEKILSTQPVWANELTKDELNKF